MSTSAGTTTVICTLCQEDWFVGHAGMSTMCHPPWWHCKQRACPMVEQVREAQAIYNSALGSAMTPGESS